MNIFLINMTKLCDEVSHWHVNANTKLSWQLIKFEGYIKPKKC